MQASQKLLKQLLFLTFFLLITATSFSQLNIRDFVLFGGGLNCPAPNQNVLTPPGCGVQIGTSGTVTGGKVGSYQLIQTTGNAQINASLHSAGRIALSNSNTVTGDITVGLQA